MLLLIMIVTTEICRDHDDHVTQCLSGVANNRSRNGLGHVGAQAQKAAKKKMGPTAIQHLRKQPYRSEPSYKTEVITESASWLAEAPDLVGSVKQWDASTRRRSLPSRSGHRR